MTTAEQTMIERVVDALEGAQVGYHMKLIRLVDGESTYSLRYDDGEYLEFPETDEVYAHVAAKKRRMQVRAVLETLREPSREMIGASLAAFMTAISDADFLTEAWCSDDFKRGFLAGQKIHTGGELRAAWQAAIDAILNEETGK